MTVIGYDNFEDYEHKLFDIIKNKQPDVIVLAAAVSDYGVDNYVDGKIRTSSDEMIIKLKPLPKLISRVREYAPNAFIVGFKLLVDSTEEELKQACIDSMNKNKLDMIVGNDLRDIQHDNHTLTLGFWQNGEVIFEKHEKNKCNVPLSEILVTKIFAKDKEK
jgi:phosphopantothenoylcysteine synthetase/decarboxylase